MKLGSLYSGGIDGFSYAAKRLGMQVCWHVESDERAHKYLHQNYNPAKIYNHDSYCGKHNLEWVNIIAGGEPCQPHSNSGLRLGQADNRYRWPEMFRIISEMRPDWVINENVTGTISNMVLDQKISDLEAIGYTTQAYVIPAVATNAHHQRTRVWLIANAHVQRWGELLPAHVETLYGQSKPEYTLGAQGNAFLQFEQRFNQPAILPVSYGIPDHVFRLGAAGNAVVSTIPYIILEAIQKIETLCC